VDAASMAIAWAYEFGRRSGFLDAAVGVLGDFTVDIEDMREQARRWRLRAKQHDDRTALALLDAAESLERRASEIDRLTWLATLASVRDPDIA
jgi:hypothetical protein